MITKEFTPELLSFLREISSRGYRLCLIGGATRDYFIKNTLSKDLDFEIRSLSQSAETWGDDFSKLVKFIQSKELKFEILPYQIVKVQYGNFSLEFSSPRLENFIPNKHAHHNFDAVLDPKLAYADSFKRRDFTINAIGIEIDFDDSNIVERTQDPFRGKEDLNNKLLRNINDDFFRDSVRFLRLVRFSINLDFKIADSIIDGLTKFNLRELSKYHFISELFKCDPGDFLKLFSQLLSKGEHSLPPEFNFLFALQLPHGKIKSREDFLAWCILNRPHIANDVLHFFNMSKKYSDKIRSYFDSLDYICGLNKEKYLELISGSFEEVASHGILKHLKNLDDKKDCHVFIHLHEKYLFFKKIPIFDFSQVEIKNDDLDRITPSLRSYYKYYLLMKLNYEKWP